MSAPSVLFDAPGPRARRRSRIASAIVILVLAAGAAWVVYTLAQPRDSGGITLPGFFDWSRWERLVTDPEFWAFVGRGLLATLQAAAIAAVIAIVVGVLFALLRTSPQAVVRVPVTIVLEFVRGMPVLLMMFFILLVASTGAFWAVVLGLGLYNGAIIGEALRAGIASLPRGQKEAGLSLGLTRLQTKMLIEFPQAFRQMLPIILAQLVVLLKDTSLGFIVGYNELIRVTMNNLSAYYGNRFLFTLFVITLVIYLAVNLTFSWVTRRIAARSARKRGAAAKKTITGPLDPADATTE